MKKLMFIMIAMIGFTFASKAQINVNINIGSQPAWGPTGYDHVDYYYLPDIDVYYDVPNKVYVYNSGNTWHRAKKLPNQYRNYDFYNGHKVVINGVDKPYMQGDRYRQEYGGFKQKHDQTPIRDSKEEKYFESKGHPQHKEWVKEHKDDNRNNNDRGRGGRH